MCGIFCEITLKDCQGIDKSKILKQIKNRGPDSDKDLLIHVNNGFSLYFYGAVLWMQGVQLTEQPIETSSGVLLYNGDIFDSTWDSSLSDTQVIMNKLDKVALKNYSRRVHIIEVLRSLKGPFSLIYYDKESQELYFMRDRIGRGSLLVHRNEQSIVISSVLDRTMKCAEIPASSVYILNILSSSITAHSWNEDSIQECNLEQWLQSLQEKQALPDESHQHSVDELMINDQEEVLKYIQETSIQFKGDNTSIMQQLLEHENISNTIAKITDLLEKSVKKRLERQPKRCKDCLRKNICEHSTVGILFSGGLDCTILCLLADRHVPIHQPIDLINVAFRKDDAASYDVPDRQTGRQSFKELERLCSLRKWNFIEVNVPSQELQEAQEISIADLIHPRQTILDESLGSALWFAARGCSDNDSSPCRLLLLGSGADELFGGYTRHRNAFKRNSWAGLHKELMLDWGRISFRNLARDNRVICDHGRQPRLPYLDEDFVKYVLKLEPWLKCFPSEHLGPGLGDKLALRLVAYKLGLRDAMSLPKRALQFGSRIANKKERGSDTSKLFMNLVI